MKDKKLSSLLESKSREELIVIIEDLCNEYEGLEERILFKYITLEEDEEIKKNKKYLSEITKKYGGGRRFVTWHQCDNYVKEVYEILCNARDYYFDNKKPMVAVETSIAIITKMISATAYMDDSNGGIGDIVRESLGFLDETCMDSDEFLKKDRTKIFNKLLKVADSNLYDGFEEWRLEIISNCIYFCDDEKLRRKFLDKLNTIIENYDDDWSGNYNKEQVLLIKLQIIITYGTSEEEEEFINNNINYSGFREIYINKCIDRKDFNKVLKLAQEGEIKDKSYAGLVIKWKKYRYIAYKNLQMIDEQKGLAKELLISGNIEFYEDLKELYINEWDSFYPKLKNEFVEKGLNKLNLYPQILIKENDLEELLEFIRADVRRIGEYDELLINDYKDDVDEIYCFYINEISKLASNRREYKKVCKIIKRYRELFGDIKTYKIVRELQVQHKKRPAFIDELEKI